MERSTIHGKDRQILVRDDFSYPIRGKLVLLAVYGDYVYWACRDSHIISRVNKFTGADKSLVKSKVFHLSSLISVISMEHKTNPCAGEDFVHVYLAIFALYQLENKFQKIISN